MKTAYRFRMYPTKQQEAQLELTLNACRHLYNLALADRKNAYESEGISQSYEDQASMLVAGKRRQFQWCLFAVLQDMLHRQDKSFKTFFRRVKAGEIDGVVVLETKRDQISEVCKCLRTIQKAISKGG
ncbi:MAG: helix-turn-helix domain-containing protein [Methanothrix sp.]|nr:helix-turn-helix domain-containing protein [Methanothrix sp.]